MRLHKLILWVWSAVHLANGVSMLVSPEATTTFWMGGDKLTQQRIHDLSFRSGWEFVISALLCSLTQLEDPAVLKRALCIFALGLALNAGQMVHTHISVDEVPLRYWLACLAEFAMMGAMYLKPATTLPTKKVPVDTTSTTPTTTPADKPHMSHTNTRPNKEEENVKKTK
jgi:peptidoglycan/LPS O-acetylase OafA/YrhL